MSIIKAKMPVLGRHQGVWTGRTRIVTPNLSLLHQRDFHLYIDFPEDDLGGVTYRQTNVNLSSDGARESLSYTAVYQTASAPATAQFRGAIEGAVTEMDGHGLYVAFALPGQGVRGFELITLSDDGGRRQRTWHLSTGDGAWTVGVVDERRAD